jgi:hypothetical protein
MLFSQYTICVSAKIQRLPKMVDWDMAGFYAFLVCVSYILTKLLASTQK